MISILHPTVRSLLRHIRRHRGPVPEGPAAHPVAVSRARADHLPGDRAAPGQGGGRAHAAAHALTAAHAAARRTRAYEGERQTVTPQKTLNTV